jgi:5-methylcytosine-specific restriction endonuclease McrA
MNIKTPYGLTIINSLPLTDLINYKNHKRLRVFFHKGCSCIKCGITRTQIGVGVDFDGNKHLDIYTDNFKMINIDHTLPKSREGNSSLENLEPMCHECNSIKRNKLDEDWEDTTI